MNEKIESKFYLKPACEVYKDTTIAVENDNFLTFLDKATL
jgi:hypothetical protein